MLTRHITLAILTCGSDVRFRVQRSPVSSASFEDIELNRTGESDAASSRIPTTSRQGATDLRIRVARCSEGRLDRHYAVTQESTRSVGARYTLSEDVRVPQELAVPSRPCAGSA
jgi:hypothetical protein